MSSAASLVISLAGPADDRLQAAVHLEANAVLTSVAPTAALRVIAVDASPDAMAIDGVPCKLYRELRPLPTEVNERARRMAWQLFWQLADREVPRDSKPELAGVAGCTREHAEDVLRKLGLELDTWLDEGAIAGIEPGPRLRVGTLLSPALESMGDGTRGDPCLGGVLRRLAARMLRPADADALVQRIAADRPYLARALVRRYPLAVLTEVLRALIDEGVTIRPRRLIAETLLAINCNVADNLDEFIVFVPPVLGVSWSQMPVTQLSVADLAQCVREGMKAHNTAAYSAKSFDFRESWGSMLYRPEETIVAGLLDHAIEKSVLGGRFSTADAELLAVELQKELLIERHASRLQVPLLTLNSCRHSLWRYLRDWLPGQVVLAYQELSPETNIEPLFRVHL